MAAYVISEFEVTDTLAQSPQARQKVLWNQRLGLLGFSTAQQFSHLGKVQAGGSFVGWFIGQFVEVKYFSET
jgi:hypothetical protein